MAGSILKHVFLHIQNYLQANQNSPISTKHIDQEIHSQILKEGGTPAFLGFNGFPASSCISLNNEIIHGVPKDNVFIQKDDLISIDIGIKFDGYYADSAYTFYYGNNPEYHRLLNTTKMALQKGIEAIRCNSSLLNISRAIENCAKNESLGIVYEYCGHGVGVELHEEPEIPNHYHKSYHRLLKQNMVIAIEPMFTLGQGKTKVDKDGFTVKSGDGSYASHFEHTVLITDSTPEILT